MSRWLSQVTDFLEQMDDQAEEIVEENINGGGQGDQAEALDSILAQRGLNLAVSHDDDDYGLDDGLDEALAAMEEQEAPNSNTGDGAVPSTAVPEGKVSQPVPVEETNNKVEAPKLQKVEETTITEDNLATKEPEVETSQQGDNAIAEESSKLEDETGNKIDSSERYIGKDKKEEEKPTTGAGEEEVPFDGSSATEVPEKDRPKKVPTPPSRPKAATPTPPPPPKSAPSAPPPAAITKDPNPALIKEAREAQKEVRTLRRHVVALNKQLETVEEEVSAQRKELDQTGGIMEKERTKSKLERDKERKKHAEEMKATQAQHEKTLMDQKMRMEQQMAELSKRLHEMENTRKQEGGTWDKELQGSAEREQILSQKNAALEDEKETFLAQIGILQSQQEALGDRIESLSQTADSAMEREREAEERLDQALSVHAHQISQRQSRERELERQLAEMGAAMASQRSNSRLSTDYSKSASDASESAGENTSQDSSLRVRLDMALHDLETAQANLDLERQRTEALQREVKDISSERTEEAANARMKQNKHDRQVAELTLQLSRMQQQTNVESGSSNKDSKESFKNSTEAHDLRNQVKELSEEILKTREKFGGSSSEIATLKSRLRAANDRAEKAERDLEDALAVDNADSYDRMERALPPGGSSMRKRGAGKASRSGAATISGAMHLPKDQKIVKGVDAIDSFSMSTGKYLRSNPVARAAFLTYLIILHLYVFVILIYHAHNFEDIHRDIADLPHGPDALMQKQLGAGGQAMAAAVSAAKAAAQKKAP